MTEAAHRDRLNFALEISSQAGELILSHYQSHELAVERKSDESPVTIADRGAEQLMREQIARQFPEDGILGEEFDEREPGNGFRWILDPIDGTKSFIHGVPLFGTLIGVEHDSRVVVGVCRFPALSEVIYACSGEGAWWQQGSAEPNPARVSNVSVMADALFCVTTLTGWKKVGREDVFDALKASTRLTRGWGDCYGHMLVATGRAEFMVDPEMSIWDAAALLPILEEAGGHFVDWAGQPTIDSGNGLSTNAALLARVLEITNPTE